jgi:hypothetical protein
MAIISKFVRGSATVDLNDGNDGFQLGGRGWLPAVATPVYMGDPSPVVETLHLRLRQTSHNNVSTYMQALHDMQVFADQYINDPTEDTPVWLHAKLDNETGERRALVRRIDVQYGASWYGDEATVLDVPLTITVTREPYWESTTARDLPEYAASAAAVIVYDYSASSATADAHDVVGDVGARIEETIIRSVTSGSLDKVWFGIRSARKADPTKYDPLWECEDGTNEAISSDDAASETNTASPGGGSGVFVAGVPTTNDVWQHYFTYQFSNNSVILADIEEMYGNYLWLMRTRTSATADIFDVQFRWGYEDMTNDQYVRGPIVELDSENWTYLEMGAKSFPLVDVIVGKGVNQFYEIQVWAQRTSGSADIYFDCICPIPIDESFLKVSDASASVDEHIVFAQSPKNTISSIVEEVVGGSAGALPPANYSNFVLPPGDGRMFVVYEGSSGSVLTEAKTLNLATYGCKYYERWLSLRGSE